MITAKDDVEKGTPRIYQLAFFFALMLLFIVISKLYLDGYLEIKRLEAKLEAETRTYHESVQTLSNLENEIKLLKTDDGVEMVARDKLRFIRPDEVVVMPLK